MEYFIGLSIVLFVVAMIAVGIKGGGILEENSIIGNLFMLAVSFFVAFIAELLDGWFFDGMGLYIMPPFEFAVIIFILIKIYSKVRQ